MPMHRWTGGKRWLAPLLLETFASFPGRRRLIVPFYGGGGESHLAIGQNAFAEYSLSDVNAELVNAHLFVARDPERAISLLLGFAALPEETQRDQFARMRKKVPVGDSARMLRFFVLVGCAFNGLWRENASGQFSAPWGKRLSVDAEAVGQVAYLLGRQGVSLLLRDFGEAVAEAGEGDLVYADPPYLPEEGARSAFDAYAGKRFPAAEHRRLAAALRAAASRGAVCVLSNSDSALVRSIYGGEVREVSAPRRIAADPARRGDAREVLITIRSGGTCQ